MWHGAAEERGEAGRGGPVPLDVLMDLAAAGVDAVRRIMLEHGIEHEGTGAAVEDRNLGRVDVDVGVVDTQPGQRRHQVFHRGYGRALAAKAGRHPRVAHLARVGVNLDDRGEIGAPENHSGICWCRAQFEIDLQAGVQANTGGTDDGT